jgi:plastocyanin
MGQHRGVNGVSSPMFVFRLLSARWRACAALVVALVMLLGASHDAFAADAQVVAVQPPDTMSWRYEPAMLTVATGSTVTWVNQGTVPITVTSPDGLFDSDTIGPGASFSYTFDTPGTFRYFCVPYPHMKGVVVVTR